LLACAIAGVCWFGYPTLKRVPALVSQFPGMQKAFDGMNARLAANETQIKAWGSQHQQLEDHFAQVEKSMASRISAARKQAKDLSDKVYQRIHGEMAAQSQETEAKLARLESANQVNVEKLQTEIAALREQTERQAEQLRTVRTEVERDGASRDQQLVSLNQEVGRQSRDLEGLNNKLSVKRVDFEVTKNHNQPLTDDLSLGITGTDVSHRRVNGWMWIASDRRTIWLRGQGAQEPIVYYGYRDGKRREVVITNVAKNSVSGYVLMPADGSLSTTASLTKGD